MRSGQGLRVRLEVLRFLLPDPLSEAFRKKELCQSHGGYEPESALDIAQPHLLL